MRTRVLILSGWGYPARAWDPVTRPLRPAYDCRVLEATTLLPGGEEERPPPREALAAVAGDEPWILVGWSLGAMLALEHAAALPGLAGLVLVSGTTRLCSNDGDAGGASPKVLRAMGLGLRRDRDQTLRAFYEQSASPLPPPTPTRTSAWMQALISDPVALALGLAYLQNRDLLEDWAPPSVPTRILHGEEDRVIPHEAGQALANRLPDAHFRKIPDTGHDLPIRHAHEVVEAVRKLLPPPPTPPGALPPW